MTEKKLKKGRRSPKSSQPFKRRTKSEMLEILYEIQNEGVPKRTACLNHGVHRNTLKLFMLKQATVSVSGIHSLNLLSAMNENQQHLALTKKIKELNSALEKSQLKVSILETIIKVAEDDLKIKIRKKSGTKQLKK